MIKLITILALFIMPGKPAKKAKVQHTTNAETTVTIPTPPATQPNKAEDISIEEFLNESEGSWIPDVYTQPYDSMLVALQEQSSQRAYDQFFNDFINIESLECSASQVPDSVYEARLKMILSPIQMPYNDIVKRYIITYTTSRKSTMESILGRSVYYFPMIEEELDRCGLPLELRMLPVIESALTPTAISRQGATGLWQFMYNTGKVYGLEINSFVDQRRDPILATKAACRMLKDLYKIYDDWTLAIAAYNCGAGNVNKAIKRAGGDAKTFWDIYNYLPTETRGYIPSFIAATYAYTFHVQHNINPTANTLPVATDTVMVSRPLHIEQVASTLEIPTDIIRTLNPQYKADIIPATGKSYSLTLPMGDITRYLENEQKIHAKDTVYLAQYLKQPTTPITAPAVKKTYTADSYTYKVKSGDTLSSIASRHKVTVSQLMKWNRLKSAHRLSIGQRLEIYK